MDAALSKFLSNLHCPLCKMILHAPYTIVGCGHTFCQTCVTQELRLGWQCPTCGEPLVVKNLRKNASITTMIACAKKMSQLINTTILPVQETVEIKTPLSAIKALDLNKSTPQTPIIELGKSSRKKLPLGDTEKMDSASKRPRSNKNVEKSSISPSTLNLAARRYVLLPTGLDADQKEILYSTFRRISSASISLRSSYSTDVTHILVGISRSETDSRLAPRTVKYLRGILDGKFIVDYEWYLASLTANHLLSEEQYLVKGDEVTGIVTNAVSHSIEAHLQSGQEAKLFMGRSFYLAGTFSKPAPSKNDIATLIRAGGGKIINRKPKSNDRITITITDQEAADGGGKMTWNQLFDYISRFKVLDFEGV